MNSIERAVTRKVCLRLLPLVLRRIAQVGLPGVPAE